MNSTEIFLAILGIVGAIVAALAGAGFGAWRTEKTATKLAKEQEFRNACRNFRNAFTKLRVELDDADGNKAIVPIIRPYRIKLKETMIEFMGILHKQKQISLKSAWISFSGEDYKDKTYKEQFYQYNIQIFTMERRENLYWKLEI